MSVTMPEYVWGPNWKVKMAELEETKRKKRREDAAKGGLSTLHHYGSEHYREIGRRGGRTTSKNREHMSEIGRRGGSKRGKARDEPAE